MSHFTNTEKTNYKSYLVAHGVASSTAEIVASKMQQKSIYNKPLTEEEALLLEAYEGKEATRTTASTHNDLAHKVNIPGRLKWNDITLKRGYSDPTSHKVSEPGMKYIKVTHSGVKYEHDSRFVKIGRPPAPTLTPSMVRQLAHKVASS